MDWQRRDGGKTSADRLAGAFALPIARCVRASATAILSHTGAAIATQRNVKRIKRIRTESMEKVNLVTDKIDFDVEHFDLVQIQKDKA